MKERTERDYAVGENHPRASLSDHDVELIRELWDEGLWSYNSLAVKFEVSRYTIRDIVKGRRR